MSMFEIGLMVKELGYDGILPIPNSSSVEKLMSNEDVLKMCECVLGQPTKYPEPHKVKIMEQEPVEDVGDFSEPEAPKNAKVAEAPKKGKVARSSKDKEVTEPEPPNRVRATRSSKGKEVAEPETPNRARATRSSKDKGVAIASAIEGEDSDASLSGASSFVDNHAPVEDTFQPLEDEEINEGESGAVKESGSVNEGEGPSGDQPLHVGPSGDHPSHAEVTFTRNEKYKLKAICKAMSCPWQIYVAWKNPTDRSLVVKYYNLNHNYVRVFENTQASSNWLRDKFLPRIQSNPTMPP
ncbi:unnamed protein product [Prunus brigantina]